MFRKEKLRKVNIHEKYTELQNTRITENIRIQKTKLAITKANKINLFVYKRLRTRFVNQMLGDVVNWLRLQYRVIDRYSSRDIR